MVASGSGFELVGVSPTCAFGHTHGFVLADWRRAITLTDVLAVAALRDRLLEGRFRGAIHMAEAGLALPDEACRSAARDALEAHGHVTTPIGMIIFGTGFGASAIRSLGTAIFTLRAGRPTRVFSSIVSGADWMAESTGGEVQAATLTNACAALRGAR